MLDFRDRSPALIDIRALSRMRVCEASAFGDPEVLRVAERPWPRPGPSEVVVEIAAAAVNPTDLAARAGGYARRLPELRPPFVLGWDLAGAVRETGSDVHGFAAGDRVVGMIPWVRVEGRVGAYAQAAAVDAKWLAPLPGGLDDATAATIPLNALTASQALDLIAAPPGSTILITGASGAVGGFATQLAVRRGLLVVAVASRGDEHWVAGLGAHRVLPRGTSLSQIAGVDALLDAVPIGAGAARSVRDDGVAVFTRRVAELEDGRSIRVETPLVHSDPVALAELTRQVAAGELRTRVATTLDLRDAAEAHRLAERGGLRGKIVLTTR
jgi:NADPH:quinone reductase-like Zn-dependent oxidoreductase